MDERNQKARTPDDKARAFMYLEAYLVRHDANVN